MHHIVILTHQHDEFDQMTHLLHGVCQLREWDQSDRAARESGLAWMLIWPSCTST